MSHLQPCAANEIQVRAYDEAGNEGSDTATVQLLVGDLELVSAEPVQALYGAPLVQGKGTAFRIKVSSSYACEIEIRVRLELPAGEWQTSPPRSGPTTFGVPPTYSYPEEWTVRIPANASEFEIMLPVVDPADDENVLGLDTPLVSVDSGGVMGARGPSVRDVPRPTGGSASFRVVVNPESSPRETDETNNEISLSGLPVHDTRPFRVLFVPWLFELDAGELEDESDYEYYLRESGYSDVAARMAAARAALDAGRVPLNVALSADDIARLQREARRYIDFFLGSFPVADNEISFRMYDYMYFQAEYLASHDYNLCNYWDWHEDVNDLMFSSFPDINLVILFRVMGCCGQSPGVYVDAGLELTGTPPNWHHLVANEDLPPDDEHYYCWDWTFPLQGAADYVISHELNHWLLRYGGECYACGHPAHTGVDCAYCSIDGEGFWVNRWMPFAQGTPYFSHGVCDGCLYWDRLEPSRDKFGNLNPDGYRSAVAALDPIEDPQVLVVRGEILRSGEARLEPSLLLPEGEPDLEEGTPGAYSLVLLGEAGEVLGTWGLDVSFMVYGPPPSLPQESDRAHFLHRIEWPQGVRRIELRGRDGQVLATQEVTPGVPEVEVLRPDGDETWTVGQTATIRWRASDPDGDALTYILAYSPDGGETWVPVEMDLTDTVYRMKTHGLVPGDAYLVRVMASDGVNVGVGVSAAAFRVQPAALIPLPVLVGAALLALIGLALIGYAVWSRRKAAAR